MNQLNEQQKAIVSFVSKYGCADMYQIYQYMQPYKQEHTQVLVNYLIRSGYIELVHEHYLIIKDCKDCFNRDIINCIWAMFKLAKDKEDITDAMIGTAPAKVFFTSENKYSFELIPLKESKISDIRKVQEKIEQEYHGTRRLAHNWTVFVVSDKTVVKLIKSCDFQFPFIVAYIEDVDDYGRPKFQIIKSVPESMKSLKKVSKPE